MRFHYLARRNRLRPDFLRDFEKRVVMNGRHFVGSSLRKDSQSVKRATALQVPKLQKALTRATKAVRIEQAVLWESAAVISLTQGKSHHHANARSPCVPVCCDRSDCCGRCCAATRRCDCLQAFECLVFRD